MQEKVTGISSRGNASTEYYFVTDSWKEMPSRLDLQDFPNNFMPYITALKLEIY